MFKLIASQRLRLPAAPRHFACQGAKRKTATVHTVWLILLLEAVFIFSFLISTDKDKQIFSYEKAQVPANFSPGLLWFYRWQ